MKKRIGNFFPFVALLLGIIAFVMVFLPALKYPSNDTTYTGLQVVTGLSIVDAGFIGDAKMPFNILALLAFLLPISAGLIGVLTPRGFIVSLVLFIAAAVLFFVLPQYTHINVTLLGTVTKTEIDWTLLAAPIIAGSASILGVLVSLMGFMKKGF
ncbi:MAG TPA: hypothetical protein GX695_00745 [Acholeplasmataceae bacterium]|nr:hypothetical protein [Acholeplasmataceae bacterium]